jgi:hypothetical protein
LTTALAVLEIAPGPPEGNARKLSPEKLLRTAAKWAGLSIGEAEATIRNWVGLRFARETASENLTTVLARKSVVRPDVAVKPAVVNAS